MRDTAPIDRELLLAHVLGKSREWIIAHHWKWCQAPFPMVPGTISGAISAAPHKKLAALLRRRARGEPLAYLLGTQWFYGRPFAVSRNVLIPRPETELLIDIACEQMTRQNPRACALVDIGTGSGCIAVTLAAELPKSHIIAIDASPDALRVAKTNARRHDVANGIMFLRGNLLEPLLEPSLRARTDSSRAARGNPVARARWSGLLRRSAPRNDTHMVVLANLPYLTTTEWRALPRAIRAYEPREALDGGSDGLRYCRAFFAQLAELRASGFALSALLEIDPRRKRALTALVRKHLPRWEASWHRDLAGHWRVLDLKDQR